MVVAKVRKGLALLKTKAHPNPIFILGNQKSGTSAISALLAEATCSKVTVDFRREITAPTFHLVKQGKLPFEFLVYVNKFDFQADIIKEPNLSLLYEELANRFPSSRYVLVVRDPRDNIRSILNRLQIPGDLSQLSEAYLSGLTKAWKLIINSQWMGIKNENYIEQLAHRWNYISDIYLENKDNIILVKYEDFLRDKIGTIENLANQLNLKSINNISKSVDIQFQPRGNRNISWIDFFGCQNLERIEYLCKKNMQQLQYPLEGK